MSLKSLALAFENEIDFKVVKEDFTRYQLEDGTLLKIKLCVHKILESEDRGTGGYPAFVLLTTNIFTALVPERLRARPHGPVGVDNPVEISFKVEEETWQEYKTLDGFLVRARPVVTKIFKHDQHNSFHEPVYSAQNVQMIQDVLHDSP